MKDESRKIYSILLLLVLMACKPSSERVVDELKFTETEASVKLVLEPFGYLEEVVGCGCYLADGREAYENRSFIFSEKYGDPSGSGFGFVKLDGDMVRLERVGIQQDEKGIKRDVIFSKDNIVLEINLELNNTDEPSIQKVIGTLTLQRGEALVKKEIVGVCGC